MSYRQHRSQAGAFLLLGAVLVCSLVGCGEPAPLGMATTPEESLAALKSGLDAWKSGQSQADLRSKVPAVFFQDDDFTRQRKLIDFQLQEPGKVVGIGYSYRVTLTLQEPGKSPIKRQLAYRVVTTPVVNITREEGIP
ncbi:hypothetical protein [Tuwongella immobilis]|uniref:Uncharacterized protein n=1 Tax=Tuwongella immobilis TaxID=692036 RepID=A0A6C2YJK2_9BACT|nr:hypothetical protein [Tuwongella immobilis]VIP01544.1 Uncharacterized protein OS=Singulisphaera acidiphila (strain ATCC BAA-1392 / DSM 18658 / VKM B-2454 / MOB10) GN=Sinac_4926 PE=4 SV=1 [Tuwongella immobilis]VTR98724.1 Uncharacterized protein OS=Singulisphaera acidiphila (strain ATCC BAA-1392 / DSM 18658 / VKM B-2454 / MOB10) GN=Sinac_4926 PE=4 SV=1 [Tuwongella immobilis]